MKDIPLRPDDIWIVSYPKSGMAWTQQIVKLIKTNGEDDDVKIDESRSKCLMINIALILIATRFLGPLRATFLDHHLMPCGLPSNTLGRYIYVARNP